MLVENLVRKARNMGRGKLRRVLRELIGLRMKDIDDIQHDGKTTENCGNKLTYTNNNGLKHNAVNGQ